MTGGERADYIHSVLEGKKSGRQKNSIKEGLSLLRLGVVGRK